MAEGKIISMTEMEYVKACNDIFDYAESTLRDFVSQVLRHSNDEEYNAWLLKAAEDYIKGKPLTKKEESK